MGDNEQNATNPVDDQVTSEAESSGEQAAAALRQPAMEGQELTGAAAAADDDVVIK